MQILLNYVQRKGYSNNTAELCEKLSRTYSLELNYTKCENTTVHVRYLQDVNVVLLKTVSYSI